MSKKNLKRASKTDWKSLDKMQDKDIDYSDIPELDAAFFKEAKVLMPHRKDSVTLRLDHDVLTWFKQQGRGYQTKINAILKAYMRSHRSSSY